MGARHMRVGPPGRRVAVTRPHPFRLRALAGGAAMTSAFGVAAVMSFGAARSALVLPSAVVLHHAVPSQGAAGDTTRQHPLQIVAAPPPLVVLSTVGDGAEDPSGATAAEDPAGSGPSSPSEGSTSPSSTASGGVGAGGEGTQDRSATSAAGADGGGGGAGTSRTGASPWTSESPTPSGSSTAASGGTELTGSTPTTSPQGDG